MVENRFQVIKAVSTLLRPKSFYVVHFLCDFMAANPGLDPRTLQLCQIEHDKQAHLGVRVLGAGQSSLQAAGRQSLLNIDGRITVETAKDIALLKQLDVTVQGLVAKEALLVTTASASGPVSTSAAADGTATEPIVPAAARGRQDGRRRIFNSSLLCGVAINVP